MWIVLFQWFVRNVLLHQQYEKGAVRPFGRFVLFHFLLVMSTQNTRAQAARHDLVLLPVRRLSTSWNSTERPGADAAAMHIEGDEGGQSCGAWGPTTPMFARRVRVTVCDRANTPPLHHHQTASSRQQYKMQKRSEPKQDTSTCENQGEERRPFFSLVRDQKRDPTRHLIMDC